MISLQDLRLQLRPLVKYVANMATRAVLQLVDDSQKIQVFQVEGLATEVREGVEHPQPYGFSSVPPPGSDVILLCVGGRRDHAIAILAEHKAYRVRNQESGESTQYNGIAGTSIVLKNNGDIEITSTGNVILNGGSTAVAKVGSPTVGTAGPWPANTNVTSGSDTVKVP